MSHRMGMACTRVVDRLQASVGMGKGARLQYEHAIDVPHGGVLVALPALCDNGLFSGIGKYLRVSRGFYRAIHILLILAFMALARMRRSESLRHHPPGELGKLIGLDRFPEVKTLRRKVHEMSYTGDPAKWVEDLAQQWMDDEPQAAGYLYVDGHVRVYHGQQANLLKRYVARERLCLRGTTDYWINDAIGRPFFVLSQPLNDGMNRTLKEEIVPLLLKSVPRQPSEEELARDPYLHRFVIIVDRECSNYALFSELWEKHRIAVITYRKYVKEKWREEDFTTVNVPHPLSKQYTTMKLCTRRTELSVGSGKNKKSMPVIEVRRLRDSQHQTAIISSAYKLTDLEIAGSMFARWCQENYFAYMRTHYDIDGLFEYGHDSISGDNKVVHPVWKELDRQIRQLHIQIRQVNRRLGKAARRPADTLQAQADLFEERELLEKDLHELREKRKKIPKKIKISQLSMQERPQQFKPLTKIFTDAVKMIAYRSETALMSILRSHLAKKDDARALIRELFVSSADIIPNDKEKTLTIRVHHMTSQAHNKAVQKLFNELNALQFRYPEVNYRMIYELA